MPSEPKRYRHHNDKWYIQVGFGSALRWVELRGKPSLGVEFTITETASGTVYEYVPY